MSQRGEVFTSHVHLYAAQPVVRVIPNDHGAEWRAGTMGFEELTQGNDAKLQTGSSAGDQRCCSVVCQAQLVGLLAGFRREIAGHLRRINHEVNCRRSRGLETDSSGPTRLLKTPGQPARESGSAESDFAWETDLGGFDPNGNRSGKNEVSCIQLFGSGCAGVHKCVRIQTVPAPRS